MHNLKFYAKSSRFATKNTGFDSVSLQVVSKITSDIKKLDIQVAQRATIAHPSPMCQGKILFKKTTEKKWKHHFPHYKSMGVFLRRSRAANSVVSGPIWPKFELIRNIMHVLVTSKYEKDRININGDYVMTSIF